MYFSTSVRVPEVPGKIVRRKQGAAIYVLYETARVYDPKRQFNVPKRVVIGKLLPDAEGDLMLPNERFAEFFPDAQLASLEPPSKRSTTLRAGTHVALSAVVREYNLEELLENSFGDKAGLVLDLATYMIITEDNAGQYFPDYARCHPLFMKGMPILSDSSVSRFLSNITRDQITSFLDDWNRNQDHRQRIYLSYDSTNKNSQAGDLDLVEFGHAKDDKGLPIINLSVAFNKTNQVPLFYEVYPGSIPDVSQLRYLLEKVDAYNYRSVGIVLDRGYFSRENIKFMDEKGLQFLMMVKGCKALVSSMVAEKYGSFETDRAYRVSGSDLYGITVKNKLFEDDSEDRYFHIFFSPSRMAADRIQLDRLIDDMAEQLEKIEGEEVEISYPYTKCFDIHYESLEGDKKRFLFAKEKTEVIRREHELCGYFCIVSSEKMSTDEAYRLYHGRDVSEKLFRADKTFLGSRSQRVHSNESLQAKIFIEFIALIIRNRFYNLLKSQMVRLKTRRNTLTVPGAIRELEKIEITRRNGSQYLLDYALTRNQKIILQSFGLKSEDAIKQIQEIGSKVSQLVDEKVLDIDPEEEENAETEISYID